MHDENQKPLENHIWIKKSNLSEGDQLLREYKNMHAAFNDFWTKFIHAVNNHDTSAIRDMCSFPITNYIDANDETGEPATIFNANSILDIMNLNPESLEKMNYIGTDDDGNDLYEPWDGNFGYPVFYSYNDPCFQQTFVLDNVPYQLMMKRIDGIFKIYSLSSF